MFFPIPSAPAADGCHDGRAFHGRLRTADGQALEGIVDGEHLTGALFAGHPAIRYARIVVTDDHGRRAWSNPIWLTP